MDIAPNIYFLGIVWLPWKVFYFHFNARNGSRMDCMEAYTNLTVDDRLGAWGPGPPTAVIADG